MPLTHQVDQSLSNTTSIQTTYSITSTVPIFKRNKYQLSDSQSTINVENEISQIDSDSLNVHTTTSKIKLLNSAKNLNTNYQSNDDIEEFLHYSQSKTTLLTNRSFFLHSKSQSRRYMSASFMLILQLLLLTCLIQRILLYYVFGITSTDPLTSFDTDHSLPVTSIPCSSTSKTINYSIFNHFLLSLFQYSNKIFGCFMF